MIVIFAKHLTADNWSECRDSSLLSEFLISFQLAPLLYFTIRLIVNNAKERKSFWPWSLICTVFKSWCPISAHWSEPAVFQAVASIALMFRYIMAWEEACRPCVNVEASGMLLPLTVPHRDDNKNLTWWFHPELNMLTVNYASWFICQTWANGTSLERASWWHGWVGLKDMFLCCMTMQWDVTSVFPLWRKSLKIREILVDFG